MDILSVINPFSTCTEVYTNCSQRRYLLGVLSNSRRGRVLSEIFKQIKWLIWCDVEVMAWLQQILLWLPCTKRYSGQCRGISWYILKKKIQNNRKWTCSIIHASYKACISIDRLFRDNKSTGLTQAGTNNLKHYVWLHQISLINRLWHDWEWQATFENIPTRYF